MSILVDTEIVIGLFKGRPGETALFHSHQAVQGSITVKSGCNP